MRKLLLLRTAVSENSVDQLISNRGQQCRVLGDAPEVQAVQSINVKKTVVYTHVNGE